MNCPVFQRNAYELFPLSKLLPSAANLKLPFFKNIKFVNIMSDIILYCLYHC